MASLTLRLGTQAVGVRVDAGGRVRIDNHDFTVTPMGPGLYLVSDDEHRWRVAVADAGDTRWVSVDGQVAELEIDTEHARAPRRTVARAGAMTAPMPATVVKILVEAGREVAEGATVLVLEAMKMELPIRAPRAGVVKALHCTQGELVQPGVLLVELE